MRAVAVCDNARHAGDKVKAGGRCDCFLLFYILCEHVFVDFFFPSQSQVKKTTSSTFPVSAEYQQCYGKKENHALDKAVNQTQKMQVFVLSWLLLYFFSIGIV